MPYVNKGIVFDLQRFSLNDGPGIRTTVFLKGCPIHCDWCHNPESQSFQPQLSFNPEKCINCFDCVAACPSGAHKIADNKHIVDFESCVLSGECVKACTHDALKITGIEKDVYEIIQVVLKDKAYYNNSGGGLTISGGEPLAQFEFTKALLAAAKKEGIHTCVDTCGQASKEKFKEILLLTDLFLYDFKMTDSAAHKQFTGSGNRQIMENLDFLLQNGANIILRCPIIPGINDNDEHFAGISEVAGKYPKIKSVEFLPYHSMGRDKASHIGMEYKLKSIPSASEEDKIKWMKFFNSF